VRDDRRRLIRALLASPWALAVLPASAAAAPAVGDKLTLVDLPLIEGGNFQASQATGKVVLVYWWASWCPYCAEMTPHVEKLWRSERERGVSVIGISVDRSVEAAREHRRRKGYTFPSAMYSPAIEKSLPKPKGIPVFWVRGKDGSLVMAESGQILPEEIAEITRFL
jgi:thiol-disulfide isomerase/thioredoxin